MTRPSRALAAWALAASVGAWSSGAGAQPVEDAQSTAAAQAIYERAVQALDAGDLLTACSAFAEVVRIEPRGAGGRLRLADCYERQGRLASAWATYLAAESAARASGQRDRARAAHDAADRIRPELSTLTVVVPAGASEGFEVLRDGADLGPPQWNVALPVDGGEHVVELRKRGEPAARHHARVLVATSRGAETIVLPHGALSAPATSATPPAASPLPPDRRAAVVAPPAADGAPSIPIWVIAVGATGLALGGAAIAFRVNAASVEDDQASACGVELDDCPRTFDVEGSNAEKDLGFAMFVGLGATSLAALAVATVGAIVGTAGAPDRGPTIAVGPGGLVLGGAGQW